MEYKLRPLDAQASLPTVTLPVTDDLPALAGQDYLAVVQSLFVIFEQCAILAARNCGVSCAMPTIVIPPQREGSRSAGGFRDSNFPLSLTIFNSEERRVVDICVITCSSMWY